MQQLFVTNKQVFSKPPYNAVMHPGGRPTKKPRTPIGERLVQARERSGISQLELADKLQMSQQTIAHWERNAVSFRSDVLTQLTEILEVSAGELLGTDEKKSKIAKAKPIGKMRQLFDAASRLPRRQQDKIVSLLEPFVKEHLKEES